MKRRDKFIAGARPWPFLLRFAALWNSSSSLEEVRTRLEGRPHLVHELAYKCRRMGVTLKTFDECGSRSAKPDIVDLVALAQQLVSLDFKDKKHTAVKSLSAETFCVVTSDDKSISWRCRDQRTKVEVMSAIRRLLGHGSRSRKTKKYD